MLPWMVKYFFIFLYWIWLLIRMDLWICLQTDAGKIAKLLIDNKVDVNAKDSVGATPLHLSATNGNKHWTPYWIKDKYVNKFHFNDFTTISTIGTEKIAKLLIDNGAGVNAKQDNGDTPLHTCAQYGNTTFISLYIAARKSKKCGEMTFYLQNEKKCAQNIQRFITFSSLEM